jgi:hypothetical protein
MKSSFEETRIEIWRRTIIENAKTGELDGRR